MKKYCFGIDVGGTTVKMGLFTTEGELLDKWEIPTRKEDGGAYILNDVAASVEAKLAEKNIAKEDVAGAGIGVPGPTLDTGYVSICVNLGWKAGMRVFHHKTRKPKFYVGVPVIFAVQVLVAGYFLR